MLQGHLDCMYSHLYICINAGTWRVVCFRYILMPMSPDAPRPLPRHYHYSEVPLNSIKITNTPVTRGAQQNTYPVHYPLQKCCFLDCALFGVNVVISLYTLTKFKSSLVELDVLVEMQVLEVSGSFCHLSTNAVISGKMTPKIILVAQL